MNLHFFIYTIRWFATLFLNSLPTLRFPNLLSANLKWKQGKSSLRITVELTTRFVIQARGFAALWILSNSFPTLNLITIQSVLFWSERPRSIWFQDMIFLEKVDIFITCYFYQMIFIVLNFIPFQSISPSLLLCESSCCTLQGIM